MALEQMTQALADAARRRGAADPRRQTALDRFLATGIPTPRHEEWKYANLAPILSDDMAIAPASDLDADTLDQCARHGSPEAIRIVMANGRLADEATITGGPGWSVTSEPTAEAVGSIAPADHPFAALNSALAEQVVVIRVADDVTVPAPIHLVMVHDARTGPAVSFPRVLVLVGRRASLQLVEFHESVGGAVSLVIPVVEADVAEGGRMDYVRVTDDRPEARHISVAAVNVHGHAEANTTGVTLGGSFVRNDLVLRVLEPGATVRLNGLSLLDERQFCDNHTVVDHVAPHCHSEELYKGVYGGRSTGVFNGKIFVREGAQKTTAYQSSRALLTSEGAQVNAKPQLEIWADDVRCSHGATTGRLDDEAVFYLRSRGLDHAQAMQMLMHAFAAETIALVRDEALAAFFDRRITERYRA